MATIQKRKYSDGSTAWLAQVRVKPFKPTSKSFPKKTDAQAWADDLERALRSKRKAVRSDLTKLTIAQLSKEFLDEPQTQALRMYDSLSQLMAWWVNHFGGRKALDVNVLVLREARDKLRSGREPATVNRYLSAMRSCWNWGRSSGVLPQDMVWPSRLMLTEPKGRTRFLSDGELTQLLTVTEKYSDLMHAAVIVSLACGVRQSELLRLKWSDVDFDRNRLRVLLTKNDESRSVFLPASAIAALKRLKSARIVGSQVFLDSGGQPLTKDGISSHWKRIRTAASLKDFRWHDLRHSCASFLAQQGANLLEIGSVLGHKSPSVTRRYSHLVEGAPVTGHTKLDEKLRGG
jgi:integrase